MDSPGSRPAEGHRWRRRRTDWYYIAGRGAHGSQFIRASRTNCQPAESSGMTGKGANQQEQIPCPQCGRHVQRRNMKKHQRSQHDRVRRRRHACPFCLPEVHKTYSTFQDWKNHLHTTHDQCLGDDDPLDREEYAAGFKLDRWERFHHIEGDENDRAYQRIATLRKHYGPYQGGVKGEPPGAPSTIRIPHTKGTTPDREVVPAESEFAGSDQDGSDQEEGEITQTEGEGSGTFTQMRPRDSDSGSDEATPGRESWRSARGQELEVLSTPRPRGRGKRRPERREGAAKRPRVESSSSDRRDGSEESRSGGGRDRPGRCSQRAARPSTPPRRPIPASVSPRRSPRLTKSAVQDLRSLPLTTKGGRRTAHSRSVSGDERGQGPRRSSLSSSDHGRSSRGRRSQSREPTPPQLRDFDVGDFTVVSHTTDSFTFASQHHFFPGWVRVVSAHSADRVRSVPCDHDAEEERRVKQKVRRGVEPPEVRRFLRQELLTKVGHSWWNRPRVYRYDRDEEREPMQSLRSVVVVPQGQEQQELSPAVPGGRTTLLGPVASPVTSLPHTPGRDIVVIGSSEESPRTREGRLAAATLEQAMGRRSVAEAIRPIRERAVASSSSAGGTITREMVAEACDTLVQERHPASPPVWPESDRSPTEDQPVEEKREAGVLAEPPTPQRKLASTPAPQGDGSPGGKERKPESALFSPSPVVGQEQAPSVCSRVLETEASESDADDEPGRKEDPPRRGARLAGEMEDDPEAAGTDQEEAAGAEPPSAQLELAILNGLDISSLPALRDLSTGARTTVHIPWPPVGLERTTPEWRRRASQAMAFLLGGRGGEHYASWDSALRQRPECRLDAPDITTDGGMWTARMHNSTVGRVLDGLVSARATGNREPEGMNEILRNIPPRRAVLPVPEPTRASPRADGTFPETGD